MRLREIVFLFVLPLFSSVPLLAQSPNGTVSGLVLDPSGAVIVGAEIIIVNDATRGQYSTKTNNEGIYVVPNLAPGSYRIQVSRVGFKTLIKPDIVLNVQDALAINFNLPIGAASETVTVTGGAPLVNTESPAVSTVIDRNFVESLPLNGRSFNTLLQLTPGVVIAPSSSVIGQGQFSIAGQRASSNNFLVDGVSANFGGTQFNRTGTAGTGSAQAFSAFGGTSSLVSVEALQEFRVETSSFAPEFGRSPGGQVILNTRSGTKDFHGGLYEYFRNDVMDANDWFNDASVPPIPRAPERHNDFGAFLGGPIQNDRTFFFVSYEGARLRQPSTVVTPVPSEYARTTAPSGLAPFLDAYPQPNDRSVTPGVYTASFTGSFSDPATLDAGSVRIDHVFSSRFSIFGRYNEAPSETSRRSPNVLSETDTTEIGTRTITLGGAMVFNPGISNSFRANYSRQNSSFLYTLGSFGGALPPSLTVLAPSLADPGSARVSFLTFDTGLYSTGEPARNHSTQLEFADDLAVTRGAHQLKFGADYRAIYLDLHPSTSVILYEVARVSDLSGPAPSGRAFLVEGALEKSADLLSGATSLYGQDVWKITPRLVLTYGLRWELDPAPTGRGGTTLAAWQNVTNPAALALATFGTPLWTTTYTNFAPRAGVAYSLTPKGDFVVRAGWGIFYDLASDAAGNLGSDFPNIASKISTNVALPLRDANPFVPASFSTAPPFSGIVQGFAPNLKLPRSYQWNVALEKSLAGQQAVSLTYVGQAGRDLLRQEGLSRPNPNFSGAFDLTQNNARSNYAALEAQYRRPLSHGLQALLNYTWSHSLDNASSDAIAEVASSVLVISGANDYSSSSFDTRHSFSGALTYAIPAVSKNGFLGQVTGGWSVDAVVVARSGFPFNGSVFLGQIAGVLVRPDLVPGQPLYVEGPKCAALFQGLGVLVAGQSCPGGKGLNPQAFRPPPPGQQGTERRNDIPGFGLTQLDFSLERKFAITERLKLQFRADAFNVLNHPNFANPGGDISARGFDLLSSSMLNHGLGGLNPLFQEGGPRSLQLSLKLAF